MSELQHSTTKSDNGRSHTSSLIYGSPLKPLIDMFDTKCISW